MDVLAVVASTVLGVVFIVAGASKIATRERWVRQSAALGVPAPIAVVVPWLELVLGAALLVRIAPVAASVVAIAVLIAFTAMIAWQLRRPERPPCACFGSWSTKPLSARDVARNVALIVVALLAAA
ncbi:MAG: MauE/DoxX family redox-associated membrane protein [Actinomycetota bacterium]